MEKRRSQHLRDGLGDTEERHANMAVYSNFAAVFAYPHTEVNPLVQACIPPLESECAECAALLRKFQLAIAEKSVSELQELYTATFDMRPDCTPDLGYHLFGDDVRRSLFLIRLRDQLAARHIDAGTELPDHLSLVLRLMDSSGPGEERNTLAADCLAPALGRMTQALGHRAQAAQAADRETHVTDEDRNPYLWALEALLSYVKRKEAEAAAAR